MFWKISNFLGKRKLENMQVFHEYFLYFKKLEKVLNILKKMNNFEKKNEFKKK